MSITPLLQATTVADIASATVTTIAANRSVVLARLWIGEGEADLRLVSSAGTPSGGGAYARLDGEFCRLQRGVGKIGQIAEHGQPMIVRGIRGDEEWLVNGAWAARQGVRSFVGLPLVAATGTLGVLAVFDRQMPDETAVADLQLLAAITASRMAAIQEIDRLRARVEELESATAAPPAETPSPLLTRAELRRIEKANIQAALGKARGKVFGPDGAAALLGMKPTTLASRIRALGIK